MLFNINYHWIIKYHWICNKSNTTNPGRFAPITCSPLKVSRFAPLNRYYIIIWSLFRQFFGNYLFISCMQKKKNHSFWSTRVKDLKRNFSCKIYKKPHKNSKKFFFVPTQKCMKWLRCCTSVQITSFLMNYASNAKIV